MEITKLNGRLSQEEKEVILLYNPIDKMWTMDTSIMKYYNKAIKQGWTQTAKYIYEDGTVYGGVFEAPYHAITIRNSAKKQMTEKQMGNLFDDED